MPGFQIIGHRGAKGEAPENTIAGFRHAASLGLTAIEIDVRLSRDRELVVIHDATVDRTTNASGPVSAFSSAELGELDARGTCPDWPAKAGVPTFDQALEVLVAFPTIQIELKTDSPSNLEEIAAGLIRRIDEHQLGDRITLSSFDPVAIQAIARLSPGQQRAYIGPYDTPAYLDEALRMGCTQADISFSKGSAEAVARAHDAGLRVVGFQCNREADLERGLAWGYDAATSDVPSTILPLLAKHRAQTEGQIP